MNDQQLAQFLALETGKVLKDTLGANPNLKPTELGALGDKNAHEFLIHQLAQHRPLDHVLSEEGEDNQGRLAANRVWIIDPLDGTSHYSKNEADYAVHVALWERDSASALNLVAGAVSVPAMGDMHGLSNELKASPIDAVRILVSATRPPVEINQICAALEKEFGKTKLISMGSVGAKLSQIIKGHADLYVNTGGFYEWDIAAPAAVAIANGLKVCDLTGQNLTFNNGDTFVPNVVLGKPQFVEVVLKSLA